MCPDCDKCAKKEVTCNPDEDFCQGYVEKVPSIEEAIKKNKEREEKQRLERKQRNRGVLKAYRLKGV